MRGIEVVAPLHLPAPTLSALAKARVGTTLASKYRLERVLGIGGMGTVYSATHRNGRRVAIKLLHPELAADVGIRSRFLQEGLAANAVDHPGVVDVLDDDIAEDGSVFLVLEQLVGESVAELWERHGRRVPPKMVVAIGCALCEVLAAAHARGVVHRDIKPENLFLTREGQLKVLDFGIARIRTPRGRTATRPGTSCGTPAFMAPEQGLGAPETIDARTDLWAVGATLFTLLSGAFVHEGESTRHVVALAATKRARPLRSVAPAVDPRLAAVVDRALEFDKAARWPTAESMRVALAEASLALFGEAVPPILATRDTAFATGRALRCERVQGATTVEPVSSTASTSIAPSRVATFRARRWTSGVRARAFLVFAGAAFSVGAFFATGAGGRRAASAPTSPPVESASARGDRESPLPPEVVTAATIPLAVSITAPPTAPSAPSSWPSREIAASRARPTPRSLPRPRATSSPPRPNCDLPFVMTAEGKKLWKPECL